MIYVNDFSCMSSLGLNKKETIASLKSYKKSYLQERSDLLVSGNSYFGIVNSDFLEFSLFNEHDSRNNRMIVATLQDMKNSVLNAISKYGKDNVAIVLGTSTSGLDEADKIVVSNFENKPYDKYHYYMQELGDPSRLLQKYLNLNNVAFTISTACSSSARAIITACQLIKKGICKCAIAGGCDSICRMPINGFNSMELLSKNRCNPFCLNRDGINIGEASALLLLSEDKSDLAICGYGQSSDAYHISSPDPDAEGAKKAMQEALTMARLSSFDIGYVNLHGTGTKMNDKVEARAIYEVFTNKVKVSSTKYLTGHTLGASGALEATLCLLTLKHNLNLIPQDFSYLPYDDSLGDFGLLFESESLKKDFVMSNAFAFGGNNASIIFTRG